MTIEYNNKQEEEMEKIMNDIVTGFKAKLINPVIEENIKLHKMINQIHITELQELADIKYRLKCLEEIIKESPLLILTAIKEAINQAGTGDNS